jgi:hypothetical protein
MIDLMGVEYMKRKKFLKDARAVAPLFWLGPYQAASYSPLATDHDVEMHLQRRDAEGTHLRRVQSNNRESMIGGVTSHADSVNGRIALEVDQLGWQAAFAAFLSVSVPALMEAHRLVGNQGHEIGHGAGGKNRESAEPLWLIAPHATTYNGSPGFHYHRGWNQMEHGEESGRWGTARNERVVFAVERHFDRVYQAKLAENAKEIGWNLDIDERGKAVDRSVPREMIVALGIGSTRERLLEMVAEKGQEPTYFNMLRANYELRKETTSPAVEPEVLEKTWGEKIERAMEKVQRETGRDVPVSTLAQLGCMGWAAVREDPIEVLMEEYMTSGLREWQALRGPKLEAGEKVAFLNNRAEMEDAAAAAVKEKPTPEPEAKIAPTAEEKPGRTVRRDRRRGQGAARASARHPCGTVPRPDWKIYEPPPQEPERFKAEPYDAASAIGKALKGVKEGVKTAYLIATGGWKKDHKDHVLNTREDFDRFMLDTQKRPRWEAHRAARQALFDNRIVGIEHALDIAQAAYKEARAPKIKLSRYSTVTVSESLAKELTDKEIAKLMKLQQRSNKPFLPKCELNIPGITDFKAKKTDRQKNIDQGPSQGR